MAENRPVRAPSMLDALIPVVALIIMLATSVYLYGADSSYGANQIALLLVTDEVRAERPTSSGRNTSSGVRFTRAWRPTSSRWSWRSTRSPQPRG